MARLAFSFTDGARRVGRMLDFIARNGPVNYYRIKEALKGKGYGGGTMQRDLQALLGFGFIAATPNRTKKKNRKSDYDLTGDGAILLLSIASFTRTPLTKNRIRNLLQKYSRFFPKISGAYQDFERFKINHLADQLLLTTATQFYDQAAISNLPHFTDLHLKKEPDTQRPERPQNAFEHRFFRELAPPCTYFGSNRVKVETILQNPKGATLRQVVVRELELEHEYHSAMAQVIEEKIKFLNPQE